MGLEPTTPCLKGRCSNQLSYGPVEWIVVECADTGCIAEPCVEVRALGALLTLLGSRLGQQLSYGPVE